ncbi:monoamine oxidase [Saccharomonospora marina XMU15]|uniref:Monoamine oxidase n=1 Tax=Saccharomonospora marina XMU15 TaxID=882083 RepID=H5X8J2_9PSEU|nr:flavin monoamine oxidase family protein [Saccharomonospora marina]EHR50288.1 monoamine oxidase [Saccharomonospora marina XMU15]
MPDVVIVGAGIAGLTAARELVAAGKEVVVAEARDRVGGRVLNAGLPGTEQFVEVGGQWIGPGQDRLRRLLDELALDTYPTYDTGLKVAELGGRTLRYSGRVPRLNPLVLADIGQAQARLDRAARRVPLESPWLAPGAARIDGQTLATWLRRNVRTATARAFFRLVTEAVWCADPEEISALWAQFYLHSGGGIDSLINTTGGAQQDRVTGGMQGVATAMAAELGERVVLSAPVSEIRWTEDGARVRAGRRQWRAKQVVVAVPPPLAARLRFEPGLPAERAQLLQRMPMGWTIKVNAAYDEPFWRQRGLSGQANSDRRMLGTVFDGGPPDGGPAVLVGFLEARHAQVAARMDAEARREAVLADLAAYFGPEAGRPAHYVERDWAAEEYTRGCYGAFATPMTLTRFGQWLRGPVGPLHWAGTETATRWAGYVDGAVESGRRVAAEILGRVQD